MRKLKTLTFVSVLLIVSFGLVGALLRSTPSRHHHPVLIADVSSRSFDVQITAIGGLEASRSHIIASSIRGDLGKLIYLISEGSRVNNGDILMKLDPTPFEEAIMTLQEKVRAKESSLDTLKKSLEWEHHQIQHELRAADIEVELAELELDRTVHGDGPQEIAKLNAAVQKARAKLEELEGYMQDLHLLEQQGFLNPSEIKQAQRKLDEEKEAYESAKSQHDSYVLYVHPMHVKKAETALKKAINKKEETIQAGEYRLAKEASQLSLAQHELNDLKNNLNNSKNELKMTEIRAPTPGMVVHREEYRGGQKRKPRIGDVLIKNQPLIDLPDLDSMVVKTRVREVELCKIQVGSPVTVKVDAYPNLLLSGHVASIGVLALTDLMHMGEEKYFEVMVALDAGDQHLRPGMTARLVIHAAHVSDAVTVPIHAIFEYAKQPYSYVVEQGSFVVAPVTVGHCNEEWAEITSGLQAGQQVSLTYPSIEQVLDPQNLLGKK